MTYAIEFSGSKKLKAENEELKSQLAAQSGQKSKTAETTEGALSSPEGTAEAQDTSTAKQNAQSGN